MVINQSTREHRDGGSKTAGVGKREWPQGCCWRGAQQRNEITALAARRQHWREEDSHVACPATRVLLAILLNCSIIPQCILQNGEA